MEDNNEDICFCKYDPDLEKEYGWAVCSCSGSCYGIRIKRKEFTDHFSFKCPNCGTEGKILLMGRENRV